jgi:beta-N-acetylhexosaminidase
MGTRTASANLAEVIDYARAFLAGLAAHGVVGCGKHFPGLGGGALDSHLETPSIARSWAELWNEDLVPYQKLAGEVPMVMVNHAAYPKTRGGEIPATASAYWTTTILKKRIGYRGLIFSDDMEMGGILKVFSMEEAVVNAVRAGLHLMEICHSPELILRGYEALIHEAERSVVFRKLLIERASESGRLRQDRFGRPVSRALSEKQMAALCEQIVRFKAEIEASQSAI